jgi:hypothetical protein
VADEISFPELLGKKKSVALTGFVISGSNPHGSQEGQFHVGNAA